MAEHRARLRAWLPLLAGCAILLATAGLARALWLQEEKQMEQKTALAARSAAAAIEASMRTRVLALERIAARWAEDGALSEVQFRHEAARLLRDFGGYEALVFVDPEVTNRWIEPQAPNRFLEGLPVPLDERRLEALQRARRDRAAAVSRTLRIANGKGLGFLTWVPIVRGDGFQGYILGVFLVEDFLENVLEGNAGVLAGYTLAVHDGGDLIHTRVAPGSGAGLRRTHAAEAAFYGGRWRVDASPLLATVAEERSPLPWLVGASGALIGLLLTLAIRQAQVARARAREAERARHSLEEEMLERERVTVALHRSEELYRTLAAHLPDAAVFLFDSDLRYLLAEGPLLEGLGLSNVRLEGKTLGERLPAEAAARLLPLYVAALEGDATSAEIPFDGRWFLVRAVPVRKEAGEVYAGMVLAQEITERRLAEEELRATAARLEDSNRELQDFAYIASHDLQEPLRKVQAFGDRLAGRYGAVLEEQGRDYLERMLGAARRMQDLLEGLLRFSRITTNARPFERCDLAQVARQVLADLEVRVEETNASIELGPLPVIDADPLQMRQVLQNLIANALKFTEPGRAPHVRIEAALVREGGQRLCELRVTDRGIGFDERYLEKIFAVFQRLHGRGSYEGSGVGLAICRKIALRHGGSITATSKPGEGSTFVVRLPAEQAAATALGSAA